MSRNVLALAALAAGAVAAPVHADEAKLQAEIAELRAQLMEMKTEMAALRRERAAGAPVAGSGVAAAPVAAPVAEAAPAQPTPSIEVVKRDDSGTHLWGYGEMHVNRPTGDAGATQADLSRAVIGFSHAFDATTRVYGEFEWEHAIASADDAGEAEVEELYVEHALSDSSGVRVGLQLVPLGFINEHHEPTQFYGVERNFVESAIIPTTWREGGVGFFGNTASGLNWNVGLVTGFDLSKWDPASDEGRAEPLGSIHQELQLAKAHDPSFFGALNYSGVPGLTVGGGVFTGKIGQGQDFPARHARLTLGEAHARWQSGPLDLSALYARGTISDTRALNTTFIGQPTPVPKEFWGGYVQGAYRVWQHDASSLVPFLRWEALNTAAEYAAQPQGLGVPTLPTEHVWTIGANYYLNPNVVFKLDYQDFNHDDDALGYANRVNLGVGFSF